MAVSPEGVPANVETVRDRKEKSKQNQTTNEEQQQTAADKEKEKTSKKPCEAKPEPRVSCLRTERAKARRYP